MAIAESKQSSTIIIKKLVRTNGDGKEEYSTQRFSKVKVTAAPQDIYDVISAMATLSAYPINQILRQDNSEIINE